MIIQLSLQFSEQYQPYPDAKILKATVIGNDDGEYEFSVEEIKRDNQKYIIISINKRYENVLKIHVLKEELSNINNPEFHVVVDRIEQYLSRITYLVNLRGIKQFNELFNAVNGLLGRWIETPTQDFDIADEILKLKRIMYGTA